MQRIENMHSPRRCVAKPSRRVLDIGEQHALACCMCKHLVLVDVSSQRTRHGASVCTRNTQHAHVPFISSHRIRLRFTVWRSCGRAICAMHSQCMKTLVDNILYSIHIWSGAHTEAHHTAQVKHTCEREPTTATTCFENWCVSYAVMFCVLLCIWKVRLSASVAHIYRTYETPPETWRIRGGWNGG